MRKMLALTVLLVVVTLALYADAQVSPSMKLTWNYTQNPAKPATVFVMQSCIVASPATACANFTDEITNIPATTLVYVSPLQVNQFKCWQVLAADATDRSMPSNTFCGGAARLNAPGTLTGTIQ